MVKNLLSWNNRDQIKQFHREYNRQVGVNEQPFPGHQEHFGPIAQVTWLPFHGLADIETIPK